MFGNVVLRERTEFFITRNYWKEKMECMQKDRIKEPPFRVLKNWGLVRGFFMSLYRSIADTPVRFVWLRANVTLELFLFLRKFVASCLGWNKCIFSLVWMMRVSHKHFIDKFVNEWEHINWLKKFDIGTTLKWRFRWIDGGRCLNEQL